MRKGMSFMLPVAATVTLDVVNSNKFYNASASGLPSPLSETRFVTNATSITVDFTTDAFHASDLNELYRIGIWDGSTYIDIPATNTGSNTKTIALPNTGTRTLRLVDSGQNRPSDINTVLATYLTKATFPAGSSAVITTPVKADHRVYAIVDSIGSGVGATSAPRYNWASVLRQTETYDIIIDGYGWRGFTRSYGTQALVDAQAQKIVAALAGATKKQLWVAIGTNDFGISYGDATTAAARAAVLLDAVYSLDNTIEIFLQTPLYRTSKDTPNSYGLILSDYTNAFSALASTRTWLTVVNATNWLAGVDLADGLHPSNSGYAKYAGLINTTLTTVPAEPLPLVFNGTTQRATIRNSGGYGLGELTITGIITPHRVTGFQGIIGKDKSGTATTNRSFSFYMNSNKLIMEYYRAEGNLNLTTTASLVLNSANRFAVTYDNGGRVRIHLNGVVIESPALNASPLNTVAHLLQLGAIATATSNASFYSGELKNLSVWNMVLPDTAINEILGTVNGKKEGELLSTGDYSYNHANCFVYLPLLRTGSETTLPNLANETDVLDLIGY